MALRARRCSSGRTSKHDFGKNSDVNSTSHLEVTTGVTARHPRVSNQTASGSTSRLMELNYECALPSATITLNENLSNGIEERAFSS